MRDTIVDTKVIKDAAWRACRAPSLHNSQPWRWVADGTTVHLFVDQDRAPKYTDTSGREAFISCGAVLDHFRVAMAGVGWIANVDRFPNPNNPHHLASIDFGPMEFVTDGHRQRAAAILARRTDRLPFAAPSEWASFEESVSISDTDVRLDVIDDSRTESLRLYDSSYHSELIGWTTDFGLPEGIPRTSLVSAAESDRVDVGRNFPVTHNKERRQQVDEDHAKILVLSTYNDARESVLRCGEALSAVLLDATMAGLATCTLTHITEVPASRQIVETLIDRPVLPQVLIRVGVAPRTDDVIPPTPRRPIDEVFEIWPADR